MPFLLWSAFIITKLMLVAFVAVYWLQKFVLANLIYAMCDLDVHRDRLDRFQI